MLAQQIVRGSRALDTTEELNAALLDAAWLVTRRVRGNISKGPTDLDVIAQAAWHGIPEHQVAGWFREECLAQQAEAPRLDRTGT
jgi:hypothetical protein